MQKPDSLVQLLAELTDEHICSDVELGKTSEAIVYLSDDPGDGIRLTGTECRLLFSSEDAVGRLLDALNGAEASLALFDLSLRTEIQDALERSFVAVDEG